MVRFLLKNIIGLWLVQESRRQWLREGKNYSFSELEKLAEEAKPFQCFIDPDAPEFVPSGNIPKRIQEYCKRTRQNIPQTEGEIIRCINESLALKYRYTLEEIKACTKKEYTAIYMVGGGIQSQLLCKFTAYANGIPVIAGPIEATVYGNIVIQLMAKGIIKDLKEARKVIANSDQPIIYQPENQEKWSQAYQFYVEKILQ